MQITESTAIELLHTMKNVEKLLKAQQKENKPVWVKVKELKEHTIWENGLDYEKARMMNWVEHRIAAGGIESNLSSIPIQFLKTPQKATT